MTSIILSCGMGRNLRAKERQLIAEHLGVPEGTLTFLEKSPLTPQAHHDLIRSHRPALVLLPPIVHGHPRTLGFVPNAESLKLSSHHRVEFTGDGPRLITYEPPVRPRSSYVYSQMQPGIP